MRPRMLRSLAGASLSIGLLLAACGSDSGVDATRSDGTATVPEPSITERRVAFAGPAEVSGAVDVRALVVQLGFPDGFPFPDDLRPPELVGIELRQSAGDTYTVTTSSLAWSEPAPTDPAQLAQEWFDRGRAVLDVADSLTTGTITGNVLEGIVVSGGVDSDPKGGLSVTVIRPVGDVTAPVVVELRHEIETIGVLPDLQLSPALLAALPDLTGCVPEVVAATFRTYDTPTGFSAAPAYTTLFEGNCPTSATFDAIVAWSATSGGRVNHTAPTIDIRDAPGASGSLLHVYGYLADDGAVAVRVDSETPID